MRPIKFRGITASKPHRWVYGYFVRFINTDKIYNIQNLEQTLVIPETVGQFTGLCDKNGKEIHEGDILKAEIGISYRVLYKAGMFMVEWSNDWYEPLNKVAHFSTITGTIHDHMLKGGKNE